MAQAEYSKARQKIDHISYFQEILDDKAVLSMEEDLSAYEKSWRGFQGKALCVLRPTTTQQVSKIVQYCAKHDLRLIPQSANTGLVDGASPDKTGEDIVINLERMSDIFQLDRINKSAHIGAGCRLSKLNDYLDEVGLYLPIDLGADPCIGGMVSTNTGGTRFLKYRGMRDHVLGIKVVLGDEDGTILDLTCSLHKDSRGMDLKHLFIASGGLFGIITEVVVRLSQKPKQSATALLVPSNFSNIPTLLMSLEEKLGSLLSAFEGISGAALKSSFQHNPSLKNPFHNDTMPNYAILIEIERTWEQREGEQTVETLMESVLSEIWDFDEPLLDNAFITSPEKLWAMRHSISEGIKQEGKVFAFDVSMKRSQIIPFLQEARHAVAKRFEDIKFFDFGHIADGGVHLGLVLPHDHSLINDTAFEQELRLFVNDLVVKKYEGSYSAEHGLGRKNQEAYHRYTSKEVKDLICAIKKTIAPNKLGATNIGL